MPLVPIDLCPGCFSAAGYYTAWAEVRDDILHAVESTHAKYPDHNVVVTGHSLGGAIASIAVGFLRQQGHIVDLVRSFTKPLLFALVKTLIQINRPVSEPHE